MKTKSLINIGKFMRILNFVVQLKYVFGCEVRYFNLHFYSKIDNFPENAFINFQRSTHFQAKDLNSPKR